jgi:hypothetical protein
VAMVVADINRNCGDRQQSIKCGSGCNGDSGCASGNRGSAASMAGRGHGMAKVTTIMAVATATTVVVNLYPLEGRNVKVDTNN